MFEVSEAVDIGYSLKKSEPRHEKTNILHMQKQ